MLYMVLGIFLSICIILFVYNKLTERDITEEEYNQSLKEYCSFAEKMLNEEFFEKTSRADANKQLNKWFNDARKCIKYIGKNSKNRNMDAADLGLDCYYMMYFQFHSLIMYKCK